MILRLPNDLSPEALTAVVRIQQTLDAFKPGEGLAVAMECVVGTLLELRPAGVRCALGDGPGVVPGEH